jgi:carboxyl-terminal processing protease
MIGRTFTVVMGFWLSASVFSAAQAEPRVALVVGNSHYGKEIGSLPNPVNDAALIAQALQQTGFQVIKVTDADQKALKRAIIDFGDKLTAAGPDSTGLFFYAGHGVQVKGMNYLVPVGADIGKESDVGLEAVSADEVLQQMEYAGSRVNIVILDACRNNPLQRGFRSVTRGLAPMDAVRGTFIAYSTAPGSVAADGSGQNSPYTAALAKTIVQPGVGIEEAFRDVRASVMAATDNNQVPWDSSSLTAPFFFKQASAQSNTASPSAPTAKPAAAQSSANTERDKALWEGIKDSKFASDYQAYLDQYPNGIYAGVAKSRLASFGQGTTRAETPAPQVQEPAAAPAAASEPVTTSEPAPAAEKASDGIERDSNGVDCRIMDSTRSPSDCKNTKRFAPANKPNGGHGSW